jgi:hypothetical protein
MPAKDAMNRSDKMRAEFEDDEQPADVDQQGFWERDKEAPKRTPIRRKDRPREGGYQQKHKRDDKRKNNPLKYDW